MGLRRCGRLLLEGAEERPFILELDAVELGRKSSVVEKGSVEEAINTPLDVADDEYWGKYK